MPRSADSYRGKARVPVAQCRKAYSLAEFVFTSHASRYIGRMEKPDFVIIDESYLIYDLGWPGLVCMAAGMRLVVATVIYFHRRRRP